MTVVAHVVDFAGGQERVTAELVRQLLDRGWEVHVIAWRCGLPAHPNLRFHRVPGVERPSSIAFPSFFLLAALLVTARRRGEPAISAGPIVATRSDIVTVHFLEHHYREAFGLNRASRPALSYRLNEALYDVWARAFERWCLRPERVGTIVPVSEGLAREVRRYFAGSAHRVEVIPNGVDASVFSGDQASGRSARRELGVAEASLVAIFVGGDWERKGLRFAVESLGQATGWTLIVLGEGDPSALRRVSAENGFDERLIFAGLRKDVDRFYAAADAFVLPTAYEAFPLVSLEAAASGLPLVVTRVSGVEDLVQDGSNGLFVERSAQSVGEALRYLGEDPERRRRMGVAARASVDHFAWPAIAGRYEALLERLEARDARLGDRAPT